GLLAFHMLTGAPAFGASPGVVQSYLQIHGPRPRPSAKAAIDPAIDEPIVRALAAEPDHRFAGPRELVAALRDVIRPSAATETDVVALYLEGGPGELALVTSLATSSGMVIALTAPDSVLAVANSDAVDAQQLIAKLQQFAVVEGTRIALGSSQATIYGGVVDGPALDVESWAPFPLAQGLWVSTGL